MITGFDFTKMSFKKAREETKEFVCSSFYRACVDVESIGVYYTSGHYFYMLAPTKGSSTYKILVESDTLTYMGYSDCSKPIIITCTPTEVLKLYMDAVSKNYPHKMSLHIVDDKIELLEEKLTRVSDTNQVTLVFAKLFDITNIEVADESSEFVKSADSCKKSVFFLS